MSESGLDQARAKMQLAGVAEAPIEAFSHYYRALEQGVTGLVAEADIDPIEDPISTDDLTVSDDDATSALAKTVIIKLNGGLGTSMGMTKAKSLLHARPGQSFLDIVVGQVMATREKYGVKLPLVFMNSFNTQDDTLAALAKYPDLAVGDIPLDFLQSQEPKLVVDDLTPVEYPHNPTLEWCPPGHGDLYPSFLSSGMLKTLLDAGFEYASVSNSDNLGATPNGQIAAWFASTGSAYAAEVCRRTVMDRKGGHLARRKTDGRLILRESAQTSNDDMQYFTDELRHPWFNTNNLWLNLRALYDKLIETDGVLGLPLIRNMKTVDPKDPNTTPVVQIETAMGAAIEVFDGAQAIAVPRDRFLPVKTTNELLLLRSDVYELDEQWHLVAQVNPTPVISLDDEYKKIHDFEERFPFGAPSLKKASSLVVKGDWVFGRDVVVTGQAELSTTTAQRTVADNVTIGE